MKQKLAIIALASVFIVGMLQFAAPAQEKAAVKIRIGAPDDMSGLIIYYLIQEKGLTDASFQNQAETMSLKDCCASTTQWALSSEELDIAVMCPDAAKALIEKDARYQVVSECTANTDVIVFRPGVIPKKIGIAQNRAYQAEIVRSLFAGCEPVNILLAGIPYAYEKQVVDGIVVDVLKSLSLQGEKRSSVAGNIDRLTSVLVVRKAFMQSPRYRQFISLYAQAVEELNQPEILRVQLKKLKGLELKQEDIELWNRYKIKFRYTAVEPRSE